MSDPPGRLLPAVLAALGIALVLVTMLTLGAVPAEPQPRPLPDSTKGR